MERIGETAWKREEERIENNGRGRKK